MTEALAGLLILIILIGLWILGVYILGAIATFIAWIVQRIIKFMEDIYELFFRDK